LEPDIILNAHIDVVPVVNQEMFKLQRQDGKLIGRGASDMKYSIASFIASLKFVHQEVGLDKVSIAMMITADEETGGFDGVGHLVNEIGYRAKYVIIPDGLKSWGVITQAKGASAFKVTVTGKSTHASTPWDGNNAILKLTRLINQVMDQHPNPSGDTYATTINIGVIAGGTAPNQVPAQASVAIDARYTPEFTNQDRIATIKELEPSAQIEVLVDKEFFTVDPQNKYLQSWVTQLQSELGDSFDAQQAFTFENASADHHYFSAHGIPVLVTKLESGGNHQEDEWINEQSFEVFTKVLGQHLVEVLKF